MNTHEHLHRQFLPWLEARLSPAKRSEVERHLSECERCRRWYERSTALLRSKPLVLRTLEPDPFLPTRIKALAEHDHVRAHTGMRAAVRWAAGSVAVAAALLLGLYIGDGVYAASPVTSDQEIVEQYSRTVAMAGINDHWQSVAETTGGNGQ
jgi:predicted anti-sigma-YlaC factor YlaD